MNYFNRFYCCQSFSEIVEEYFKSSYNALKYPKVQENIDLDLKEALQELKGKK